MRTLDSRSDHVPIVAPDVGHHPACDAVAAWTIPIGVVAWLALGVVARAWMRLISDDPEFSWSGTVFIVVAFGVAGLGHSVARVVRSRARRRWSTVARALGAILTLPLFAGAGAAMLPTVVGGSLAAWRQDWVPWARVVVALVAVPIPAFLVVDVVGEGHGWERLAGLVLLVATYTVIVRSMRHVVAPLGDGWRMPRWVRRSLAVLGAVEVAMLAVGAVVLLAG